MRSFILILLFSLIGCGSITTKDRGTTYQNKVKHQTEACIVKLLNEGIHEQLVYPICKDIYGRRPEMPFIQ